MTAKPLTFAVVDDLAFAAANRGSRRIDPGEAFEPRTLGALFEFLYLVLGDRLPADAVHWLLPNGASPLIGAFRSGREQWLESERERVGFIRARRSGTDADYRLMAFLMTAQRAARDVAGFPSSTAGQLAAAIEELENNIQEHSEAVHTGVVAFRAAPGLFEMVAGDLGIGVLASLRNASMFGGLTDHGTALETALSDGASRFEGSRRGHGFRPIFLGLMNLNGSLRFRSGDHALLIDGTSPTLATSRLAQKAPYDGFFVSVQCAAGSAIR